jgi:hypothetical protein
MANESGPVQKRKRRGALTGGPGWVFKFKNENQICSEIDSLQKLASRPHKFLEKFSGDRL